MTYALPDKVPRQNKVALAWNSGAKTCESGLTHTIRWRYKAIATVVFYTPSLLFRSLQN